MRKVSRYLTRILAIFTLYALSSFSSVWSQSLSVFILYGEDAVSYVEVCQGSTVAFTVEVYGGSGSGHTYTWSGDTNPTYFNDLGDLVSYKNTTPAGTYNLTVDVEDDGGFTGTANLTVVIKPSPLANIVANGPTTFCDGDMVELEETNGQTGVTYQWQRNFSNISGAINTTYNAGVSGNYRIRVSGSNGCSKLSNVISVTANPLPSVTASNDGPICYNGTVNLTSSPDGYVSYTWTTDAVTPFNSTEQNPSITNVTPNNNGDYTVTVKDVNGCENTALTSVFVHNQLDGGTIAADQTICYSADPVAFTNSASPSGGTGAWSYAWESKEGMGAWSAISGANSLTYDVPAGLTKTTQYRRSATNSCGTVYSNVVTVTVYDDLDGGSIGSSHAVCYGGDPNAFSNDAAPSGGDGVFTYIWQSKVGAGSWTDITGATAITYDVPAGLTETTMYRRVAMNTCGTVYSNELTVTVYDAIDGGVIADNQFVCYGGDPDAFTDVTSPSGGNGAWSYAWQSKVGAGLWGDIGVTTLTYDIPAGITQTTIFRRVSSNLCGSANSNELTVTVYPQMNGGTISGDQSLCYNSDPTEITSTAVPSGGNGPWTYSWEYQVNCAGPWATIAGASGLSYDPPANQIETRCYRRVAVNDCGTVYSNIITITIHADIDGGTIAADRTVCYGGDPDAFTSSASASGGNGAFTYFWQQNTGSGWNDITGASGLTYDVIAGITQTTQYRRGATNLCGTGYSNTLTVTVSDDIEGGQISLPDAVCYNGDPDAFTDVTSPSGGAGIWAYTWEYRVGMGSWNVIGGANGLTYDIPAGQTETRTYRRVATNDCGTGYSNEVTVVVYDNTIAGSIAGNQTLCFDGDPDEITSVSLPTGGSAGWAYAWEYQSNCAGAWNAIAGANATSYNPPANQTETRCYRRVETNACGTIYSNTVTITIIPAITGNTITADQVICSGSTPAQLTGPEPTGGSGVYAYQWQHSTTSAAGPFTDIAVGAQNQDYSPSALTQTTYYRRVVTSGPCSDYSNTVTVEVNPPITNNTIAAAQTICYNTTPAELTGSIPVGGNGTYTYVWEESTTGASGLFTPIAGAINATYQPGSLTQDTWYRRSVTSLPCADNISNVIKITVSPEFTVTGITTVSPTCNGYNDGSATVNTLGGIAPYTYSWSTSPVQTNQTATGLLAGVNYTVTVTDAAMCPAVGNVTLTEPAAIALGTVTANPVTGCFGDTNGSIQITGTGGTPNYTYTLYLGATLIGTQTPAHPTGTDFTGLAAGTYSVNITDVNSCPAHVESNILVLQPDELVITDVQTTPISCAGSTDGTITVIASGGTGVLEYSVDGIIYQPGNVFTVGAGYYDISVRDANGCITTWPTQIEMIEPSEISFNYEITNITTCNGDNVGKISITNVTGGSGTGYEYSIYVPEVWGNNTLFENLPGGSANPYYIKVRDSHGCIKIGNNGNPIYINQPAPITFNVATTDVTGCWYNENGTIRINSVAGGTGSKQVSIDGVNYFPTNKVFNVGVGTYTVSVRDGNGCIATKPAIIGGPAPIVISTLSSTNPTCFGSTDGTISVSATGGTGALEYSIDGVNYITIVPPATEALFTGLIANIEYTIYVRDANGCILDNQSITLTQPPIISITQQDFTPITCHGANDGTITLAADGGNGAPFSYSIDGGATYPNTTGLFTGLSQGIYHISVQDKLGCTVTGADIEIIEPAELKIDNEHFTNIICHGETNGTITITASGGNAPLVYTLKDATSAVIATNGTGAFTGLGLGTYTVEVDDANGCGPVISTPITIDQPALLDFTYTVVDLTCYNDGTGKITVSATGGVIPYQYFFDGADYGTVNEITGLNGGDYTVTVRDANGCETTQVITVVAPDELVLSLTATNITCNGLSNGEIVATAVGGTTTTPYQYRIDGGAWQASGTFSGLSAKTYLVEVMDANGCIDDATVEITEPAALADPISTLVQPTCTTLGSITVEGVGGTAPYTYTLNPGTAGEVVNTTGFFDNLTDGHYIIHIQDANSCGPHVWETDLVGPPPVVFSVTTTPIQCNGETSTLTINVTSGTAPYQYSIDNEATYGPSEVFPGLAAGTYQVWVVDANNCKNHQDITITQPDAIVLGTPVVTQETSAGASDGKIELSAMGGTGDLRYDLYLNGVLHASQTQTPPASALFENLGGGTYYIIVTDQNGCTAQTSDITISGMSITVTVTNILCYGDNNGTITVNVSGGDEPYNVFCTLLPLPGTPVTITPTGNPNEYSAVGLGKGEYNVTVSDNVGNIRSQQVEVIEPAPLVVTYIQKINPSCNGETGRVVFDIDGGIPTSIVGTDSLYTIELIRDGVVEATLTDTVATGVLPNVKYDFRISDFNGCFVLVDTIQPLTEPEPIVITEIVKNNILCNGASTGSVTVTLSGGVEPFNYTLTGPVTVTVTDGIFTNLPAGTYTLSITDANGCSPTIANNPFDLTEPTPIIISGGDVSPDPLTCPYDEEGEVKNISVTGGTPEYTYLWSNGETTLDVENLTVGDHKFTVTDANGCQESAYYTIIGPAMLRIVCDMDPATCRLVYKQGDPTLLGEIRIVNTTGGNGTFADLTDNSFQWDYPENTQTPGKVLSDLQSGYYRVHITDTKGCEYDSLVALPIKSRYDYRPDPGEDTTVCFDNPVVLHGRVIGGDSDLTYTYEWYMDPDLSFPILSTEPDFEVTTTGRKRFMLKVVDSDEVCYDTAFIDVSVHPEIGLHVPLYISAVQDSIVSVLMGNEINLDVITKSVEFETKFEWQPAEMFIPSNSWNATMLYSTEIKSQIPQDRIVVLEDPKTKRQTEFVRVSVVATTDIGCTDTLWLYTKVVDDIAIGNVFSPNDDGKNDVWTVPKKYLFPDLSIEVFNRWGSLVWSATGDAAARGWNGRTSNGRELPIGTYYYIIKFNVKAEGASWKPLTGSVTIVK